MIVLGEGQDLFGMFVVDFQGQVVVVVEQVWLYLLQFQYVGDQGLFDVIVVLVFQQFWEGCWCGQGGGVLGEVYWFLVVWVDQVEVLVFVFLVEIGDIWVGQVQQVLGEVIQGFGWYQLCCCVVQ